MAGTARGRRNQERGRRQTISRPRFATYHDQKQEKQQKMTILADIFQKFRRSAAGNTGKKSDEDADKIAEDV